MTRDEARQLALAYIETMERETGLKLALVDKLTMERNFGWVFFYDSQRHLDTGDFSDAIAGNAPIVVTKAGQIHVTGTARPLEYYLAEFETRDRQNGSEP